MKKTDCIHAFLVAIIFTCLLAVLLLSEPADGIPTSPVATFDIEILFRVVIGGFVIYLPTLTVFMIICSLINLFLDDEEILSDLRYDSLSVYIGIAISTYCLMIAFGIISVPGVL